MDITSIMPSWAPYIPVIVAVASALAAIMPAPSGLGVYAIVYRLVNWTAVNLGHARNASDPAKKDPQS